jgi:hypothetical protein
MAILRLDNQTVGQTSWRPCSQQAWDQRFSLPLDRARELEISIYWKDYRSLCAIKYLRLEDFIDYHLNGMAIHLEPQGILFAEIKFVNPLIRPRPKLQRQKKLFTKRKGKDLLRAGNMNIDVLTWTRLIKRGSTINLSNLSLTFKIVKKMFYFFKRKCILLDFICFKIKICVIFLIKENKSQ